MNLSNNTYRILIFVAILSVTFGNAKVMAQGQFVCKVQEYQEAVKLHDESGLGTRIDFSTFNVSDYLSIYNKIQILEKKEPRFIYRDWRENGKPLWYALKDTTLLTNFIKRRMDSLISERNIQRPLETDFETFYNNEFHCDFAADSVNKLCNNVIPEDSKQGYLQYLFLKRFGENFALKWHSNYSLGYVVSSQKDLKSFYNDYKDSDLYRFEKAKFEELTSKEIEINIKRRRNYYFVRWMEFMPHHGIFEVEFRIERKFPYHVEKVNENKLLEISPAFIY